MPKNKEQKSLAIKPMVHQRHKFNPTPTPKIPNIIHIINRPIENNVTNSKINQIFPIKIHRKCKELSNKYRIIENIKFD